MWREGPLESPLTSRWGMIEVSRPGFANTVVCRVPFLPR